MKIWLITDTHFGHEKLSNYWKYRPVDFEKLILKNIARLINKDDLLIHLGDVCIGNDEKWHDWLFNVVPGKKWLVKGNHDHKSNSWYLEHGWDFVGEQIVLNHFGKKILFSHEPIFYARYIDIDINIHGHFHDNEHRYNDQVKSFYKKGFNMLLAIERTNYEPVLLESFLKKI